MGERREQCLVQQLVTQSAIEALDKGILLWLARCDVMPFDPRLLGLAQDRHAGQLSAVVGDTHHGTATRRNEGIEFPRDPQSG